MAIVPKPTVQGSNRWGNLAPAVYMLIAMICYSCIPLVIALNDGAKNPLLFSGIWRFGTLASYVVFICLFYRPLLNRENLTLFGRTLITSKYRVLVLLTVVSSADYALFALSAKFIDIAITSILFEIWPIITIFILARLYEKRISHQILWLLSFCFIGIIFVVASQTKGFIELRELVLTSPVSLIKGFIPVTIAVVVTSFSVCAFKCGSLFSQDKDLVAVANEHNIKHPLDRFGSVIVFMISNLVSVPVSITLGLTVGVTTDLMDYFSIQSATFVFLGGGFLAVGAIFWQTANAKSDNSGINAMAYFTPIFSLLLLSLFSQVGGIRVDYLIIGASAIIISNLLIIFDPEIRWGFKALIIGLGVFGIIVYLRDGVFESLGVDKWHWTTGGYFEALALSATVFTLLLAFRVARLISRTGDEENRTFDVFRKLDLLARRGVINGNIRDCILRIDAPKDQNDLENAYGEARNYIAAARANVNDIKDVDLQLLTEAEANLDALARSKQQDITPGEMFALFIFAGITVSLALLSRPPEAEGWNRLLVDIFAILISAVIIFLVVNVWDLRRERDENKLELRLKSQDYMIRFSDTKRRSFDQWLSIVVGTLIVLVYAGLLSHKWVGWFPWLG